MSHNSWYTLFGISHFYIRVGLGIKYYNYFCKEGACMMVNRNFLILIVSMFLLLAACSTTEKVVLSEVDLLGEFIQLEEIGNEACVDCHENYVNHFEKTPHAQALESLFKLKELGFAKDSCLQCHSTDYILTKDVKEKPTLDDVTHSLTCLACHLPHDKNEGIRLRLPKEELCISCHTAGQFEVGDKVRHSQKQLYYGNGGIDVESNPSPMSKAGVTCYDCHMPIVGKGLVATGEKEEDKSKIEKSISSHSWKITLSENVNSCLACHTKMPITYMETKISGVQEEIGVLLEQLEVQFSKINVVLQTREGQPNYEALKKLYDEADINFSIVKFDKSNGYHNYAYAKSLLEVAQTKLNSLEEAVK